MRRLGINRPVHDIAARPTAGFFSLKPFFERFVSLKQHELIDGLLLTRNPLNFHRAVISSASDRPYTTPDAWLYRDLFQRYLRLASA
ncbi:MAG: hypothetical protein R3C53_03545 [Pirellulaceae bacterium]